MTREQLDCATYLCGVLTDNGSLSMNAAWELSEAFHYLRREHQSSAHPHPGEEAQPGPVPSAPAAADWPCWVVEEPFDANDPETEPQGFI